MPLSLTARVQRNSPIALQRGRHDSMVIFQHEMRVLSRQGIIDTVRTINQRLVDPDGLIAAMTRSAP
jgi:hypothetical protein